MTTQRAPAITPDVRHSDTKNHRHDASSKKVVSFGQLLSHSKKKKIHNNDHSSQLRHSKLRITKEEAARQYKLYRSCPILYPSYDRIKLVKLPPEYLPNSLRNNSATTIRNNANNNNFYWPAIIYHNLVEVVRDLSPKESPMLKAKLIVEYKKDPTRKAARLIGWNVDPDELLQQLGNHHHNKDYTDENIVLFAESKIELLHLPSLSDTANIEEENEETTRNFCESLLDMEHMYSDLIEQLLAAKKHPSSTKQFAIRFGYALDMALNCLSQDVGSEPLVPRMYEGNHNHDVIEDNKEEDKEDVGTTKVKNHGCKTPNSNFMTSNIGCIFTTTQNISDRKYSPAEEGSVFSAAAVAPDNDDCKEHKNNFISSYQYDGKKNSKSSKSSAKHLIDSDGNETTQAKLSTFNDHNRNLQKTKKSEKKKNSSDLASSKQSIENNKIMDNVSETKTNEQVQVKIPWKDIWATMKRFGWTWKGGTGLMTDYYYIKPKCKVQGGVSGVDYFVSVEETMEFARRTYGWDDGDKGIMVVSREEIFAVIEEHAKYCGEIVPPLTEDMAFDRHGPWRDAWHVMLRSGWMWRTGSGLMMDYYYIKPGCKVAGGVVGQDYFVRVEDVQKFAMRNYGWRGNTNSVSGEGITTHVNEGCGATRGAQTRRSSSSMDIATGDDPVVKRPKPEVKMPLPKESIPVESATKNIKLGMARKDPHKSTDGNDRDAEEDDEFFDTHSTFSQSGLQSKKLFSDECADEFIPELEVNILCDETWSEAWRKMRDSGWKWKTGTGLMTDYYYIKPGCKVKGGLVGRDFFIQVADVQRFAMRHYGWRGGIVDVSASSTTEDLASMQRITTTSTLELSSAPSNPFDKKVQWQELQRRGWKAINAGRYNRLHDWYYVRPHCDPGDGESQLGIDFFLCEEDAIESAKKFGDVFSDTSQQKEILKESRGEESENAQACCLNESTTSPVRSAQKGTPAGPLSTPQGCRTRPQDPAIPLLYSPESCSSISRSEMYEWHNLWPSLVRAGWRCVKAAKYNPLHDYYYVRPDRDPSDEDCELGKHYFECKEDVVTYIKDVDSVENRKGKKDLSRKSVGVMLGAFEEVADEDAA